MLLNVWNHLLGTYNVSQHLFQHWIRFTLTAKSLQRLSVIFRPYCPICENFREFQLSHRVDKLILTLSLRLPQNFVCSVVLNLYCPKYGTLKNLRPCARGVMMHRSRGVAEGVCGTGRGNTGVHPALLFPHGKCCYLYLIEKENLLKWPEMPVVFCGSCIRGRQ